MKSVTKVFWYSLAVCTAVVIWGAISPGALESITNTITTFISVNFGWYYLLIVMLMLIFSVYLIFSKYGKIKLGKEHDKPEFSLPSWFAMLFSAGMGMGLVFWTTAEPVSHAFLTTPGAETGSEQAIKDGLKFSFFHWGVHAWAVYGIVALVLAYFKFYRDTPGLISATLVPLFGKDAMEGIAGKLIDVLAVVATIFGVAATLGFGSGQITGGLSFLFGTPDSFSVQIIVLVVATLLFIVSAWSGIGRGIKYLSNINMGLAFVLLLLLFIVGPTLYILNMFTNTLGNYISDFFDMSLRLAPLDNDNRGWINS